MPTLQGYYWIGTVPCASAWSPPERLPEGWRFIKGQQEIAPSTGYAHWQLVVGFMGKRTLGQVVGDPKLRSDPAGHWELTRSRAANEYVWKDDTAVANTRFQLGDTATKRGDAADYGRIVGYAVEGNMSEVRRQAPDVFLRFYNQLNRIASDNAVAPADLLGVCGLWIVGPPGVGKSHYVREFYGQDLYYKMPNKWWDGYKGQKYVLIDDLGIQHDRMGYHLKIWSDKYAFTAEKKGGTVVIRPDKIIVTSNYEPNMIFKDYVELEAIERRFYKIQMTPRISSMNN